MPLKRVGSILERSKAIQWIDRDSTLERFIEHPSAFTRVLADSPTASQYPLVPNSTIGGTLNGGRRDKTDCSIGTGVNGNSQSVTWRSEFINMVQLQFG